MTDEEIMQMLGTSPSNSVVSDDDIASMLDEKSNKAKKGSKEDVSTPKIIGKALASGALSLADIPHLLAFLGENYFDKLNQAYAMNAEDDTKPINALASVEPNKLSSYVPAPASKFRESIGLNEDLKNATAGQRIGANIAEGAGSMLPIALSGGVGAAGSLAKGAQNLAKAAGLGGAIGGVSGSAQELGANPLLANIGSAIAVPSALGTANKVAKGLYAPFNPQRAQNLAQEKASRFAQEMVGQENIPQVVKNLEAPTPFGLDLTVPERAQNAGLSMINRAVSPTNPRFVEKTSATDSVLRKKLSELGTTGLEPEVAAEEIRKPLFEKFQKLNKERADITAPLYEKLRASESGVPVNNTLDYINDQLKHATGKEKAALLKIQKDLIRNNTDPRILAARDAVEKKYAKALADYRDASPEIKKRLEDLRAQELASFGTKLNPTAGQLDNLMSNNISDQMNAAANRGELALKRTLQNAKEVVKKDLEKTPEGLEARKAYAKASEPLRNFDEVDLVKHFVERDKYNKDFQHYAGDLHKNLLNSKPNEFKALVNEVKDDPKAINAIRGSMADEFLNKTSLSSQNALGDQNFSYDKLNKFLKGDSRKKLEYVFDKDQLAVLDKVKDVIKRRNMAETVGRAAGSPTAANIEILDTLADKTAESIFAQIGKAVAGESVTKKAFSSLKAAKNIYKVQETKAFKQIMREAMLDPQLAKTLLLKTKDVPDSTIQSLVKTFTTPIIAASSRSVQDKKRRE